jgi:hypothetical protein
MQESSSGVGVLDDESVYRGEMRQTGFVGAERRRDAISPDEAREREQAGSLTKRAAIWGAGAGFLFGLVPLIASTLIGASAGVLIAKASRLRVERVTPPSVRLGRRGG